MRSPFAVLAVQLVLATVFLVLVATGSLPFTGDDNGNAAPAKVNRFDGPAAFNLLKLQLSYGPRPAGSKQSRKLANKLRTLLPNGRFQPVPGGLRNVVGTVPGRDPGASWWSAPTTTARTSPASWGRTTARAARRPPSSSRASSSRARSARP